MPDRKKRDSERPEFEVAYYTKELGKTLQRQMLQRQLAQLGSSRQTPADDGDSPAGTPAEESTPHVRRS